MNYIELRCEIIPAEKYTDRIIAELTTIGYESFLEEDDGTLLAYIPEEKYNDYLIASLPLWEDHNLVVSFTPKLIKQKNWNEEWEKDYHPVVVTNKCGIRASFHKAFDNLEFDVIINPKMSFGTAHHETTCLMIEFILNTEMKGKYVADMGTGTGVLAILTAMKGAEKIIAVDNDKWAVDNAKENVAINNTDRIEVIEGDSKVLEPEIFNCVLANINRNILLTDMEDYSKALKDNGILILSGFYSVDLQAIIEKAKSLNLSFVESREKNNWTAALFILNKK